MSRRPRPAPMMMARMPAGVTSSRSVSEIHLHPQGLMVGASGVAVDSTRRDPARERGRDGTEVDPFAGADGDALVFAIPGGDPRVDEPGQATETAVARGRRSNDAIVLGSVPSEIEVAHQDRVGRHRGHLAFGPSRAWIRMPTAPRAALARRARVNGEELLD